MYSFKIIYRLEPKYLDRMKKKIVHWLELCLARIYCWNNLVKGVHLTLYKFYISIFTLAGQCDMTSFGSISK